MFLKEEYNYESINFVDFKRGDIELLCFNFNGINIGRVTCATIYRPPKGNVDSALASLNSLLKQLGVSKRENVIIHGDFNINLNRKQCKWVKKLRDWEIKSSLKQVIKTDTRIGKNAGTRIDHCFTNLKNLSAAGTININVSDHFATFLVNKKEREEKRRKIFEGRDTRNLSWEAVGELLEGTLCHKEGECPDSTWINMEKEFKRVADTLCPIRRYEIKNNRPKYFTTEISTQILARDRLFKLARNTPNGAKRDRLWKNASVIRKEVCTLIRKAKRDYVTNTLEESKKIPKCTGGK